MGLRWVFESYDVLPSTQDLVKERADAGEPEGLVVQARVQSGGYGRHGRRWVSPGGNLYFSFLLRPECGPQRAAQLALVAGLAVYDAVAAYAGDAPLMLKWPNDVLLVGRKCAGILLETELGADGMVRQVVLGIGINIESAPSEIGAAVAAFCGHVPELSAVRGAFFQAFDVYHALWLGGDFEAVRRAWLERAGPEGRRMSVKAGAYETHGCFHSLDVDGNLLLKGEDGQIRTITAGDVYFGSTDTEARHVAGD